MSDIEKAVLDRYTQIAAGFSETQASSCCAPAADSASSCCSSDPEIENPDFFKDIYKTDISSLPDSVTGLSLGCGDPLTIANLEAGQTVVDLGSGGGIDCFLAARQVGPTGTVIGIDMTEAMLEKAEANKAKVGLENVEFRYGKIEDMPVGDNTTDVIISNCVINLSIDKPAVFREAFRILKPGGKLAVSDMVRQGEMTPEERADMIAWSGCITGAEKVSFYVEGLKAAGFNDISIRDRDNPQLELADQIELPLAKARVFSARITAVKPA